jgi:hypothetical protein
VGGRLGTGGIGVTNCKSIHNKAVVGSFALYPRSPSLRRHLLLPFRPIDVFFRAESDFHRLP